MGQQHRAQHFSAASLPLAPTPRTLKQGHVLSTATYPSFTVLQRGEQLNNYRDQELAQSYVVGLPCSQPRLKSQTRWLKLTSGMCAQDPERRMEEKGLRRDHPPWGVISRFLSLCLCLSGKRTHPIAKASQKKKKSCRRQNSYLI